MKSKPAREAYLDNIFENLKGLSTLMFFFWTLIFILIGFNVGVFLAVFSYLVIIYFVNKWKNSVIDCFSIKENFLIEIEKGENRKVVR